MAKVGIMSMQRIANYGSFLQAYALIVFSLSIIMCAHQLFRTHLRAQIN